MIASWGLTRIGQQSFFESSLRVDTSRPLYQQIIEAVQRALARGELAPGDQIPSQRELAQQLRINPNTVQRAYREMEYMGLVTTARGTGTFITSDSSLLDGIREQMAQAALGQFLAELRSLGFGSKEIVALVSAAVDDGDSNSSRA